MGDFIMAGKGSRRRFENTEKVQDNIGDIKWGTRDKSKDTFVVKKNGQLVKDDPAYICYQCDKHVMWLAPDSRCIRCTKYTPEEIRGEI